jgi:hypothetical protein
MAKTKDYTTFIPVDDKLLEIKVKVFPRGTKNKSRWEKVCQWGRNFAKENKLSPKQVDRIVSQRRYGS